MSLFRNRPPPDSVKLGRTHAVTAEVHYSSGVDHWWYHGRLWLNDTPRPVHEYEFNPILTDPRNGSIIAALKQKGRTEADVAKLCDVPIRVVREVHRALQTADEAHLIRVYGLESAQKEEERILVTVDQDLIHEAPMIAYTRTEKGARRLQWAMMMGMIIVDSMFIFMMFQVVQAGPALAYDATQVVSNMAIQFGQLMVVPISLLILYVGMARKTLILDMEVQPVIESITDTHTEAVYLVNSEKTPASTYITRLFRLDPGAVRELTEEIARFQSDAISSLQEQTSGLRAQLDWSKILGIERFSQNADMAVLGRATGSGEGTVNWTAVVLVAALVTIVAVVGTYVVMTTGA